MWHRAATRGRRSRGGTAQGGTIETSVNSGARGSKNLNTCFTCLNDPPKYVSTPWRIDIYPPALGGGVRTWPGLQSTFMREKNFAHDVNTISKAKIVDCNLVGMVQGRAR